MFLGAARDSGNIGQLGEVRPDQDESHDGEGGGQGGHNGGCERVHAPASSGSSDSVRSCTYTVSVSDRHAIRTV